MAPHTKKYKPNSYHSIKRKTRCYTRRKPLKDISYFNLEESDTNKSIKIIETEGERKIKRHSYKIKKENDRK